MVVLLRTWFNNLTVFIRKLEQAYYLYENNIVYFIKSLYDITRAEHQY